MAVSLTEAESELVQELKNPDHERAHGWVNFDPDFTRMQTARLRRNGWIEERGEGRYREYKLTDKGISALP